MCRTCGCDDQPHHHHHRISLETDLLAKNDRMAEALRARLEHDHILALNLIGAPGAGKTTLLEHTIRMLAPAEVPVAVIEGDQATDHDAQRIASTGSPVTQVNTGTGCHLDASMIERGLGQLRPRAGTLLFIENVGNLVCPALFDLGERAKVVAMSITEGEDKPLKYPHVFRAASVLVLTKVDLAPHVDVDPARCIEHARRINPALKVFPIAARRGHGMAEWIGWLRDELEAV
jgi:hydrogenase nickel incorporation protein HypB